MSHYDRQGRPITIEEWGSKFSDMDYRRVEHTRVGKYRVSTVWLGNDYNYFNDGPPIIFETMVFDTTNDEPGEDVWCQRYTTEEQAIAGHKELVQDIEEGKELSYE